MLLPPNLKRNVLSFRKIYAKYNGGGGCLQQRPLKFNNIMNIINIINMLLISIDLAATGKIITCTEKLVDPKTAWSAWGGGGGGAAPHENLRNL